MSVQAYLRHYIDKKETFKQKNRSRFFQQGIKEIKVANIGPGMTFGDTDVFKQRGYMFTLKTGSSNVITYEMSSKQFMLFLQSRSKEKDFSHWAKK